MATDVRHDMIALIPRLRRFARALAGSTDDADDLVQGACERALRAIDSWEPGTRLDSWMFRICVTSGSISCAARRRSASRTAQRLNSRRPARSRSGLAPL